MKGSLFAHKVFAEENPQFFNEFCVPTDIFIKLKIKETGPTSNLLYVKPL